MIRSKRPPRKRDLTVAFLIVMGTLLLTVVWIVQAGGPAFAAAPTVAATCTAQSTNGGTQQNEACAETLTATELEVIQCNLSTGAGQLPVMSISAGGSGATLVSAGSASTGSALVAEVVKYEYGFAGSITVNCSSQPGGNGYVSIGVSVWQNVPSSDFDQATIYQNAAVAGTSVSGIGYSASGISELAMVLWAGGVELTSCSGWTQAYYGTTGDSFPMMCWGNSGNATAGAGAAINTISAIILTWSITLSGGVPASSTTTTTVAPTTTTTDCPTVNGNEYCSGYPPTTISGESCAWDVGINGYICPTFTPTTTTTTTVPATTTTTSCQTLYSGTTPTTVCSGIPPTTIDGETCDWNPAISEYTCQETSSQNCAFYDIICELQVLFDPSGAAIASMDAAIGTSGLNTVQSGLSSIGSSIYTFASDGVSYSGGLYGSGTSNDYCLAFENGDPYDQYEGAGPPAYLNDGHLDLNNNLGGATATGGVSQYGGDSNVSPGNLCYWQGQMNTVITNVPDWPYLKDIVETGLVIMTIIGALRIVISAFQSGK